MASLSLPRVLQLKKNSLDAEREQFEKFQTLAIQKAINSIESPVKEKHVRSTIIGTFQEQSAITYWMVAIRLPLQDNRIVAWKFCHVTHKLLREGHPACLDDSQRHITMIENLGKLWVHLREGYGKLVNLYCSLLVCKLKFHARNPRFPGNMQLTADELDAIAENDVNNYFQICVELFDYMDDILNLQAAVFDSLGNARANSMTASGQCRLAALIPCAQDSSHIYDCNVRLLFRLHAALPPDTLAGHRDRFRQQFKKLSSFYKHASSLQYYRNLLTLPLLPSNPPNFLLQSDFGTYVTPVVSIPEQPPDELDSVGSLIDTSDTISQSTSPDQLEMSMERHATPSPQPDPVVERDRLIDHLQNELKRMRSEVSQLVQERNTMLGSMREHCSRLETQLQTTKAELEEERRNAEMLMAQTPEIKQKLTETEDKARVTDEKFQKLKGAYTQLREEHIALIRQKAEVDKMSATLRATAAQHESAKMALQQQLSDKLKDVELLQQSTSSSEEIEAYKNQISSLRNDLEQSRCKELELETLKASMETLEIEHKTSMTEQQEKLTTTANELKEVKESLESIIKEKEERESELNKVKAELVGLRENSKDEYKKVVEEKEKALAELADLTQKYESHRQEQDHYTNNLQADLEILQQKLNDAQIQFTAQCEKHNNELNLKSQEVDDHLRGRDSEVKEVLEKLVVLQAEFDKTKIEYENNTQKQNEEISDLSKKIDELTQRNLDIIAKKDELEAERDSIQQKLNEVKHDKLLLQEILSAKEADYKNKILQLAENEDKNATNDELINSKNKEIFQLNEQLEAMVKVKDSEFEKLQEDIRDKSEVISKQVNVNEQFIKRVAELESEIFSKSNEINELNLKINELNMTIEKQKYAFEGQLKDTEREVIVLQDKLKNVIVSKDEIVGNMKSMLSEKDGQVINLNVEVNKLTRDVSRLEDELNEALAELEIANNELLAIREEHDDITDINQRNLVMKNTELRALNKEVSKLTKEKDELLSEKEKFISELLLEKQVRENKVTEMEESLNKLNGDYDDLLRQKIEMENDFKSEIGKVTTEHEVYRKNNVTEMETLKGKIVKLEKELDEIESFKSTELDKNKLLFDEYQNEKKITQARLNFIEREKMTAECELQDLLLSNQRLEVDLGDLRKQLEEAHKKLEEERRRVVSAAGGAARRVAADALAALERGAAPDAPASFAALGTLAQHAADQLALIEHIKGNEEAAARAAILVAHGAAQLAAYATELSAPTDLDQLDKLTTECRSMLRLAEQCASCVAAAGEGGAGGAGGAGGEGGEGGHSAAARALALQVRGVARAAAAAAPAAVAAAGSVDDELANMDAAIEAAAKQIEEMLAASRAGDSGVKLEVNGKILDACTTLMGAVRALVRDARRLQAELGGVAARHRAYRRNPQWSEGLISAAKAVVFAAKLLVSSADEAVGASGRVEGVCAAAHEVAGSTAQLVAASRARAPPASPALAALTAASRSVAAATGALVAAVRAGGALLTDQETLDTSSLSLTATRRLEMESKVRALELEVALDAERARLAALRKRHYHLAQLEENGNVTNGKE